MATANVECRNIRLVNFVLYDFFLPFPSIVHRTGRTILGALTAEQRYTYTNICEQGRRYGGGGGQGCHSLPRFYRYKSRTEAEIVNLLNNSGPQVFLDLPPPLVSHRVYLYLLYTGDSIPYTILSDFSCGEVTQRFTFAQSPKNHSG